MKWFLLLLVFLFVGCSSRNSPKKIDPDTALQNWYLDVGMNMSDATPVPSGADEYKDFLGIFQCGNKEVSVMQKGISKTRYKVTLLEAKEEMGFFGFKEAGRVDLKKGNILFAQLRKNNEGMILRVLDTKAKTPSSLHIFSCKKIEQ